MPFSSGSQTLLFFSWQAAGFRETLDPITCVLQGPKPKVSRSGKHPAFKWLVHSRSYWRCIFYQKENGKRGRYQMPLVISFLWLLLSQLYHANIQLPSVIQCVSCRARFHSLSNGLPGRDFFFNLYPDCTASDQTSYQSPLYRSAVFNWCEIVLLASSETQMSAWFCFPAFSLSPPCVVKHSCRYAHFGSKECLGILFELSLSLPGELPPSMDPTNRLSCTLIFTVIPHYLASRSVMVK